MVYKWLLKKVQIMSVEIFCKSNCVVLLAHKNLCRVGQWNFEDVSRTRIHNLFLFSVIGVLSDMNWP